MHIFISKLIRRYLKQQEIFHNHDQSSRIAWEISSFHSTPLTIQNVSFFVVHLRAQSSLLYLYLLSISLQPCQTLSNLYQPFLIPRPPLSSSYPHLSIFYFIQYLLAISISIHHCYLFIFDHIFLLFIDIILCFTTVSLLKFVKFLFIPERTHWASGSRTTT